MNRSLSLAFIFVLSGCSPFTAPKAVMDPAFFSEGDSSLSPSTDKLSENCFAESAADACIYFKNPVAQEKRAVVFSEADSLRKFAVKVRGLSPTGFLENARVRVYSLSSPRFTLAEVGELKSPGASSAVEQFSAYYWSNRLFDYLEARLGADRLPLTGLKIYADDAFTGFSSVNKSIHLEKSNGRFAKALSGEIIVHLTGQALAHALSGNRLFAKDNTQHNLCVLDPKACCRTIQGCAQALGNSFGEYLSAVMFPATARVGESLAQSVEGQSICAVPRDLASLAPLSRAQIYSACAPQGRAVLMGAWYASLWWKLRAELEEQEPGSSVDVDKLFFDHARVWSSTSTFVEARAEALRLAAQYKGGKYQAELNSAFTAAGL